MNNIRLVGVLVMLLLGGSTGYAFSLNQNLLQVENEITTQLSEDHVDISYCWLTTSSDTNNTRLHFSANTRPTGEDSRLLSRSKAYYSHSRFLEPGLGLPDIIFPFHTFL